MADLFIKSCHRVAVEPSHTRACEVTIEGVDLDEVMSGSSATFDEWFDAIVNAFDNDRTSIMDKLDRSMVISYFNLKEPDDDE